MALSGQQLSACDIFGKPAFNKKKWSWGSLLFDLWGGVRGSLSPGWSKRHSYSEAPRTTDRVSSRNSLGDLLTAPSLYRQQTGSREKKAICPMHRTHCAC